MRHQSHHPPRHRAGPCPGRRFPVPAHGGGQVCIAVSPTLHREDPDPRSFSISPLATPTTQTLPPHRPFLLGESSWCPPPPDGWRAFVPSRGSHDPNTLSWLSRLAGGSEAKPVRFFGGLGAKSSQGPAFRGESCGRSVGQRRSRTHPDEWRSRAVFPDRRETLWRKHTPRAPAFS